MEIKKILFTCQSDEYLLFTRHAFEFPQHMIERGREPEVGRDHSTVKSSVGLPEE